MRDSIPVTVLAASGGTDSFDTAMLAFGALLMAGALVSGLVRRSFLSLTALFVVSGFVLGEGGVDVLGFDPESGLVHALAIVALVVILFRDGLEVEAEMLQTAWRLPLRKLVLAMPITAAIVAVAAHVLTDLGWGECFLLGALLSPTDPVLSSSVVTNPRVPRLVRHSLNLESGLNDGLALPAVLAFSAALRLGEDDFVWWEFVLRDVTLGFAFGLAIGYLASHVLPRGRGLEESIPDHQKSLYALGTAFATYGLAVGVPPKGNGLIAVFVCAIMLGIRRPDLRTTFEHRADDLVEIVKLGVFVVFGALLTFDGLFGDGLGAVAIVAVTLLVARPVAIWLALLGARLPADVTAFMAWFGPKGVATMTFSLLVLADDIPGNERIFSIAALCVFVSILAHGLTDTPGSEWIANRAERPAPGRSEAPMPPAGDAPGGTRSAAAAADAGPPDDRAGTSGTARRS
jgi:NhaP-type Na+/H+ or K+/H+ antiporter